MTATYDYGWWGVVAVHIVGLLIFAWTYARPMRRREWRSMGAFSAFVVALLLTYYWLALREDRELAERFGPWSAFYRQRVPAFIPRWTDVKQT